MLGRLHRCTMAFGGGETENPRKYIRCASVCITSPLRPWHVRAAHAPDDAFDRFGLRLASLGGH